MTPPFRRWQGDFAEELLDAAVDVVADGADGADGAMSCPGPVGHDQLVDAVDRSARAGRWARSG